MANLISQITPLGSSTTFDIKASALHYIAGSGTAAVTSKPYNYAKWEGTDDKITEYYNGLTILYKVGVAGNGTYGTCLRINNLAYHPVVTQTNTMISTRYGVGAIILLVYTDSLSGTVYANANSSSTISGVWVCVNNYVDGNDTTTLRSTYTQAQAGSNGIKKYSLFARTSNNTFDSFTTNAGPAASGTVLTKTSNVYYDISKIYYLNSGSNYAANAVASTSQFTWIQSGIDIRYSVNIYQASQITLNKPFYLVFEETSHDGYHALASTWWTQTLPSSEDNKIYVLVGYVRNSSTYFYSVDLHLDNPAYIYKGGAIQRYYDATSTVIDGYVTTDQIGDLITAGGAMVFKGVVGTGTGMISLPTTPRNAGWTYRVGTAGTYAGKTCEVGDMIICIKDVASGGTTSNDDFVVVQANIDKPLYASGNTLTNNAPLVADGTDGKVKTGSWPAETDPTVPAWAKEENKPSYTASEVGAATATHAHGNITTSGTMTTTVTATTSDRLILADQSDSWKIVSADMSAATSTLLNSLGEGTSPATASDYIIAQYAGGGTTTKTYHRRKLSNVLQNLDKYHTTGSWSGLTYTASAVNSAGELAFTIPTGTTATTVAVGNHNHDSVYIKSSDLSNPLYKGNNTFTNNSVLVADGTDGKVKVATLTDQTIYTVSSFNGGTLPTLTTTNYTITSFGTAGSIPSLSTVTYTVPNVIDVGTLPSLTTVTYTIPNVIDLGSAPSLSTTTYQIQAVTEWNAGSKPTLGTAFTVTCVSSWDAGSAPTLGTAFSVNSVNVSSIKNVPTMTVSTISGTTDKAMLVVTTTTPAITTTSYTIPNVTSAGSAPSLSTKVHTIPNVTNAGNAPTLTVSTYTIYGVNSFSPGSTPSFGDVFVINSVNQWSAGTTASLGTAFTISSVNTWNAGTAATAGTTVTVTAVKNWNAGAIATLTTSTVTILQGWGTYDSVPQASGVSF